MINFAGSSAADGKTHRRGIVAWNRHGDASTHEGVTGPDAKLTDFVASGGVKAAQAQDYIVAIGNGAAPDNGKEAAGTVLCDEHPGIHAAPHLPGLPRT